LGYGVGSGNSIPGYVPVDGFMAMIEAVKEIRRREVK
jgi:thioredoxin-related protein